MKRLRMTVLLLLFGVGSLYAQMVVAAHPAFPAERLTLVQLRKIYLGKMRYLGGKRLLVINLPLDDPLRQRFEKRIVHHTPAWLNRYWLRQHYLGHRPPKVMSSEEGAALLIRHFERALGYMHEKTARTYGLKILFRMPAL